MDTGKKLLKNFMGFSLGPFVNAFIGFLSVPIVTRLIIPEEFGKASMYTTAEGLLFIFLYLGMDYAFLREYNEAKSKPELLQHSIAAPVIVAILIGIILNIVNSRVSIFLFNESHPDLIIILTVSLFLNIVNKFSMNIIRMDTKAILYSVILIVSRLVNFIITIGYLLFISATFEAVVYAGVISTFIVVILELIITRKYWFTHTTFNVFYFKKLLKLGIPVLPSGLLFWGFNSLDKIAIRTWSDFTEIGLYAGAFKIVILLNLFKKSFTTFWIPTAYSWYSEEVPIEKYQLVSDGVSFILTVIYIITVAFRNVIIHFLSSSYVESARLIPFLLFSPIMVMISETTVLGIHFSKKSFLHSLVTVWTILINIAGNLILVPRYGALGAAIATGISYVAFLFFRTYYSNRLWIGIKVKTIYINVLVMILISFSTLFSTRSYIIISLMTILVLKNNASFLKYLTEISRNKIKKRKNSR